jgi:hypothetical protein
MILLPLGLKKFLATGHIHIPALHVGIIVKFGRDVSNNLALRQDEGLQ